MSKIHRVTLPVFPSEWCSDARITFHPRYNWRNSRHLRYHFHFPRNGHSLRSDDRVYVEGEMDEIATRPAVLNAPHWRLLARANTHAHACGRRQTLMKINVSFALQNWVASAHKAPLQWVRVRGSRISFCSNPLNPSLYHLNFQVERRIAWMCCRGCRGQNILIIWFFFILGHLDTQKESSKQKQFNVFAYANLPRSGTSSIWCLTRQWLKELVNTLMFKEWTLSRLWEPG